MVGLAGGLLAGAAGGAGITIIIRAVDAFSTAFAKANKLEIKRLNTHEPRLEEVFLKIIERGG